MAQLTGSFQVDGNIIAESFTGSVQGTVTTASYIAASNIDGDVTNAQNIYVNNYDSYNGDQRIAYVGGVNQYHALRADTVFNFNPGQNKLSVPNVNATTLTGSLDWDQLDNVPDGIMSSSDGIVPDGTVSSSAQTIANLNSTGIISGSSQITSITIKEQNANNYYPILFANSVNPSGDFQGQAAYSQIPGGTERIRFNPGTGQLELGNLLGSGSIYAYGMITGDEFTAETAFNGQFLNLKSKVAFPDLPSTGQDSYMTLSATSSKSNYQIQFAQGLQFDPMWSYKAGGYGNQWTRVLTEQNIASGSATLTQVWVNGLVTGSTAEFTTISGSTISGSFVGDGSGLTGLTVDSVDYDNVNNKPTLFSGSSQVDFDSITNVPDELISASNGDVTLRGVLELSEGPSIASTQRNLIIGLGADHIKDSSISYNNTVIGVESGQGMQSGSRNNTLIGDGIMYNDGLDALGTVTSNTVIGHESMKEGYGIGNVVLGRQSLLRATSANNNIVIGNSTLDTDDYNGSSAIVIGNTAGDHLTGGNLNILIGDSAGPTTDTSLTGKLYIDVEESDTPLIYGDFVSDEVTINGDLDVTGTTSGSFIGDGSGLTGISADSVDTASYVSASNVDGEVYEAERARRIEVGSYGSYSSLTDIPFITGDYGNNIKRISADGSLQWHAGTNHLTVPGVNATTLTGSLDHSHILNAPFSSSNPVSPVFHPSIGSTDRGHVAIGEGVLEAGISASNISYGIVAIGQNAAGGLNAGILGSDNVVIGRKAAWNNGNLIDGCTNLSVVVGAYSNNNSSGVENVTVGAQSFTSASGHSNTTVGTWAGNGHGLTGNCNTMIGHQAGGSDAFGVGMNGGSCRNTLLGAGTSLRNGCNNVLIGYGAGSYTDFNNKLYIENGGSSPLIEGDFSTNCVKINDVLELNQSDPLPSGGVGQLAVSASNLYFHNGSSWSQIN